MQTFLETAIDSFGVQLGSGLHLSMARLSACGDYIVLIDSSRQVKVCRLSTNESWRVPVAGSAILFAINDAHEVAILSDDGFVQRFDLSLPTICLGQLHIANMSGICYDHTGTMLYVSQTNGRVRLYDLETRPYATLVASFKVGDKPLPFLSARRETLLGVDRSGRLYWVRGPETEAQLTVNGASHLDLDTLCLTAHPFLTRVLVGGIGPYARLYFGYNLKPMTVRTSFSYIRDFAFRPDLNQVAIVGDSGVEFWNLDSNQIDSKWHSPSGHVFCARFFNSRLRIIWG